MRKHSASRSLSLSFSAHPVYSSFADRERKKRIARVTLIPRRSSATAISTNEEKEKRSARGQREAICFHFCVFRPPDGFPRERVEVDCLRGRARPRERVYALALGYPGRGLDRTRNTKGANYNDNAPSSAKPPPSGPGKEIRHVRFAGGALTTALPSRAIVP